MKKHLAKMGWVTVVYAAATAQAQAATPVDFSNLVEQVSPAVVSVNVVKTLSQEELLQQQIPEMLRRFFGNQVVIPQQEAPQEKTGYGSAFFISKDGYLITNHHVIEDASRITITLNDRREIDAVVVGSDKRTDVAVLKVDGRDFPALRTGNVDQLRVGEPVLAIGSPFGFDYSASAGIVSAKSRTMSRETGVPFIQTDVALNPGNSGGPLFNQRGEVVGVNSRIFSGTGGYMGLSFSIPIDVAMDVAEQLKTKGKVSRAYLGVMLQDIDRNLAEAYKLPKPEGSLVTEASPGSPADKAGLKAGDVILKYNAQSISRTADLITLINRTVVGQTVELNVLRNGKTINVRPTLISAPDDTPASQGTSSEISPKIGLQLRELADSEKAQLKLKNGVLITQVQSGSNAARVGLMPRDVITQVNDQAIKNVEDFASAIQKAKNSTVVRVSIVRGGQNAIVGLRIQ